MRNDDFIRSKGGITEEILNLTCWGIHLCLMTRLTRIRREDAERMRANSLVL